MQPLTNQQTGNKRLAIGQQGLQAPAPAPAANGYANSHGNQQLNPPQQPPQLLVTAPIPLTNQQQQFAALANQAAAANVAAGLAAAVSVAAVNAATTNAAAATAAQAMNNAGNIAANVLPQPQLPPVMQQPPLAVQQPQPPPLAQQQPPLVVQQPHQLMVQPNMTYGEMSDAQAAAYTLELCAFDQTLVNMTPEDKLRLDASFTKAVGRITKFDGIPSKFHEWLEDFTQTCRNATVDKHTAAKVMMIETLTARVRIEIREMVAIETFETIIHWLLTRYGEYHGYEASRLQLETFRPRRDNSLADILHVWQRQFGNMRRRYRWAMQSKLRSSISINYFSDGYWINKLCNCLNQWPLAIYELRSRNVTTVNQAITILNDCAFKLGSTCNNISYPQQPPRSYDRNRGRGNGKQSNDRHGGSNGNRYQQRKSNRDNRDSGPRQNQNSNQKSNQNSYQRDRRPRNYSKSIVCYGCNEVGHRKTDCPHSRVINTVESKTETTTTKTNVTRDQSPEWQNQRYEIIAEQNSEMEELCGIPHKVCPIETPVLPDGEPQDYLVVPQALDLSSDDDDDSRRVIQRSRRDAPAHDRTYRWRPLSPIRSNSPSLTLQVTVTLQDMGSTSTIPEPTNDGTAAVLPDRRVESLFPHGKTSSESLSVTIQRSRSAEPLTRESVIRTMDKKGKVSVRHILTPKLEQFRRKSPINLENQSAERDESIRAKQKCGSDEGVDTEEKRAEVAKVGSGEVLDDPNFTGTSRKLPIIPEIDYPTLASSVCQHFMPPSLKTVELEAYNRQRYHKLSAMTYVGDVSGFTASDAIDLISPSLVGSVTHTPIPNTITQPTGQHVIDSDTSSVFDEGWSDTEGWSRTVYPAVRTPSTHSEAEAISHVSEDIEMRSSGDTDGISNTVNTLVIRVNEEPGTLTVPTILHDQPPTLDLADSRANTRRQESPRPRFNQTARCSRGRGRGSRSSGHSKRSGRRSRRRKEEERDRVSPGAVVTRSTVIRNRNEIDNNRRSRRSKSDAAVDLIRTLVRNITRLCDVLQARVDCLIRDVD